MSNSNPPNWLILPLACVPLVAAAPAFAVQYLTTEAAQKLLFPAASGFVSHPVKLDAAQKQAVEKIAGVRMRHPEQPVWQVMENGKPAGWYVQDVVYANAAWLPLLRWTVGLALPLALTFHILVGRQRAPRKHTHHKQKPAWHVVASSPVSASQKARP